MTIRRSNSIFVEISLLKSKAYRELSALAKDFYHEFLFRRKMSQKGTEGKKKWVVTNNGDKTRKVKDKT